MGQHGCDDIGVMDLLAAKRKRAGQRYEFAPYSRAVFQDGKAANERVRINGCFRKGEGSRPGLRPSRGSKIFPQHLARDGDRPLRSEPGECCPGTEVVGGGRGG